jgi:hypothetical protein
MPHAQKPDFVFRRNGRVHLNRRGASVQDKSTRLTSCCIAIYRHVLISWKQLSLLEICTWPASSNSSNLGLCSDMNIIIIIIGIQALGRSGQRPELSQATGMVLVRCILGKFLGVVCHCFPPGLDVLTFAIRCLHVRHDARDPSGGRWNCGWECFQVILPKWRLPRHLRIFYIPQIYDMGPTALLPLRRKACWGFFRP